MTSKHYYATPSNTIEIKGKTLPEWNDILTLEALVFLEKLHFEFETTRQILLENRKKVQKTLISIFFLTF